MAMHARRALVAQRIAVVVTAAVAGVCVAGPLPAGPAVEEAVAGRLDGPAVSVTSPRAGATVRGTITLGAQGSGAGRVTRPSPAAQPGTSQGGSASHSPPPRGGYFSARPVGSWSSLPGDASCTAQVRRSTWEPRPDNDRRNHMTPDPAAVHRSFSARPVGVGGSYDSRWDSWLLQRVDGQFTGTTDEIFQWAACKWGLADDVLRAIAVRESTWYQYETYPSGRPVNDWGSGDLMPAGISGAKLYCDGIAKYGYDYQRDLGSGRCPRTFSIVGVMSWQDPSWGSMPGNQNGTFPFNRDSTAFAVDYLGSQLRGCYEGWESWLSATGSKTYRAGDMSGCVGAWYAGEWRSSAADGYTSRVQSELANFTWLTREWPSIRP